MILQALVAYYDRQHAVGKIAPPGWLEQGIGWIVHIDANGRPTALECTYDKPATCKEPKTFTVPAHTFGARTGAIAPYVLWDTAEYTLGLGKKKVAEKLTAFTKRIKDLNVSALNPLLTFLTNNPVKALQAEVPNSFARLQEDKAPLVTFRLAGDNDIACARQDVRDAYDAFWATVTQGPTLCLPFVQQGAMTVTAPKNHLPGALGTGCNLVAFKEGKGFDSYGKTQGANAPISEDTTFRYTTALQALIDSPDHRIRVGEETLLFWSSESNPVEDALADLLGYHTDADDDSGAIALKGILTAAQKGQMPGFKDEGRFWLLLLQPVSARIAVRLWVEQTPTQTAEHLRDWFADLDVVKPSEEDGRPIPIYRLLASLSPQGDVKNLPPRLGGELLSAALRATPLPDSIAQAVLRRLKSLKSKDFTFVYAALLKAWLIRKPFTQTERKPTPMLDPDNDNPGYCLGRLFAVLEKTQQEALGNVNASIKDKFYATASADPAAVFGSLLRTATHHEGKLTEGRRINLERLKMEILGHLADIPAHLELADQARFALGYYHQRRDLFTKKEKPEAAPEAAPEQPITIQENLGI